MSVAMYPGATALTLTPLPDHSLQSALVSWATPPLLAAYAGTVSPPWKLRSDARLMILPSPRSSMGRPKSWQSWKTERRLTAMTSSQASSGKSTAG